MKSFSNRLSKIESKLPFDPAFWYEKNKSALSAGNEQIWSELSDDEFILVYNYVEEISKTVPYSENEFGIDLNALTDEQFLRFDVLVEQGTEPVAAYAACQTDTELELQ